MEGWAHTMLDTSAGWRAAMALSQHAHSLDARLPTLQTLGAGRAQRQRLLAVWDFRVVTHSLGDLVVLHQRMELLRWELGLDQLDIAMVWDPQRPYCWDQDHYNCGVTADNWHLHMPALLTIAYLNRAVGSVLMFNSHDQFEDYLHTQSDRYVIWPSAHDYLQRELSHGRLFDTIQSFWLQHRFIPWFGLRPATVQWLRHFYERHVAPDELIVAQFRNNPRRCTSRNANLEVCLEFLADCRTRYPAKFVLIGAAGEIDPRFRRLENVVVAKDHGTTLEQDMALANRPLIFLGGMSGPAAMAYFSDTPCLLFNASSDWETVPRGGKYVYMNDLQRMFWEPETPESLRAQFGELFERADRAAWWRWFTHGAEGSADGFRSNMGWEQ